MQARTEGTMDSEPPVSDPVLDGEEDLNFETEEEEAEEVVDHEKHQLWPKLDRAISPTFPFVVSSFDLINSLARLVWSYFQVVVRTICALSKSVLQPFLLARI
jgi:hypothetical protein